MTEQINYITNKYSKRGETINYCKACDGYHNWYCPKQPKGKS